MKRLLAAPLLLLLVVPLAIAADTPAYPKKVEKELYAQDFRGKKAPDLIVEKWLADKPDTKGKVVLIDFWATWCPPCRKAIPELNGYQKTFKDDLVVIGISQEDAKTVQDFAKTTPMEYSLAIDTKATTGKKVGVTGIPHVLILSTDGIVRWQGFPFSKEEPLTADIVKQIIDADPGITVRHAAEKK